MISLFWFHSLWFDIVVLNWINSTSYCDITVRKVDYKGTIIESQFEWIENKWISVSLFSGIIIQYYYYKQDIALEQKIIFELHIYENFCLCCNLLWTYHAICIESIIQFSSMLEIIFLPRHSTLWIIVAWKQ